MNSKQTRNTLNTSKKKMLTMIEVIAVATYLLGYDIIALAIVVVTLSIRFGIELKARKTSKDNMMALVVNGVILVGAIVILIRCL